MKSFGKWFAEQGAQAAPAPEPEGKELPDGLYMKNGVLSAYCRACENSYEWSADPSEGYDHDYSYCGRSPSCCP